MSKRKHTDSVSYETPTKKLISSQIGSPIGKYQPVSYDPFDTLSYKSSDPLLYYQTIPVLNEFLQTSHNNGGIFMVIYLNIENRDVMIPVFFTDDQFVSDCKHDFDGKRGDKKSALNVRKIVCDFFKKNQKGDDKVVLNRLNNILDHTKDEAMFIKGQKEYIEKVLIEQLNAYIQHKNEIERPSNGTLGTVFSIGSEEGKSATELLEERTSIFRAELPIKPRFLELSNRRKSIDQIEKRIETLKMNNTKNNNELKHDINELLSKPEDNSKEEIEEGNEILILLDQGITRKFISDNNTIKVSYIQDMYDKNNPKEINPNTIHEFCVGFFAINKTRSTEIDSLFLRHIYEGNELSINKTFYNGTNSTSFIGQPSISGLLDTTLTPMQIAIAKFAGDHIAQITNIIKYFGKNDQLYSDNGRQIFSCPFTHDSRSFLDSYNMKIITKQSNTNNILLQDFKFPTIFSRVIKYEKSIPIRLVIVIIPKERKWTGGRSYRKRETKKSNRKSKSRRNRTRKSQL